jgi:hypothetical protein
MQFDASQLGIHARRRTFWTRAMEHGMLFKIHSSGNPGRCDMPMLYRTANHPHGCCGLEDYAVLNNLIFRTNAHPLGYSAVPDYWIKDGEVFRTVNHPEGCGGYPDYMISGNDMIRTRSHPWGESQLADYKMR